MAKDYYDILGVSKDASPDKIKRAYKRLAKKYHPDLNKNSNASEKFKEINEAYKVLGDSRSKENYDRFGSSSENFTNFEGFGGFDFSDMFGDLFGFGRSRHRNKRGEDLQTTVSITLEEAAEGTTKNITLNKNIICRACDGHGGLDASTCSSCQGTGMIRTTRRTPFGLFSTTTPCNKCKGRGHTYHHECQECHGAGIVESMKKISITIPAGIDDGMQIRISGEGDVMQGATPGDLYVIVNIKSHPVFKREGKDLYVNIPISFIQAVFGDEIEVPTLKGKARLKLPSGTQTHTLFKLKGYGLKGLRGGRGDEYVRVRLSVPTKIKRKQRKILEDYARESGDQISLQKGFWSKLKEAFDK